MLHGRKVPGGSEAMLAPSMRIYTKTGDDGTTGLLFGGRISKSHPAAEAYGSVDEAVAALGVSRALASDDPDVAELILRLQRELFVVARWQAGESEEPSRQR
jgi:cob(I)alamin adenosyltransferase